MTSRCSYCGEVDVPTKEHLFPAGLHQRLIEANDQDANHFWLRRIGKEIPAEPVIRDVCRRCNNDRLSKLDDYICELFERQFIAIPQRYEHVMFEYDYHLLKRWLLKVSYNSARIHAATDLFTFPPLLPYILGEVESVGRSVQLYLQLTYPVEIPAEALKDPMEAPAMCHPLDHRLGHLVFSDPLKGYKVLRAIHLRSYSFFLAFFEPGGPSALAREFSQLFLARHTHAVLLKASKHHVSLTCDGVSAWESFNGARENAIVFKGQTL